MIKLTEFIKKYINLDEEELNIILASFTHRPVTKDDFVIKKEQVVTDYYFIYSGALIIYAINEGIQHTRYFAFENEFIADISKIKIKGRSN